MKRKRIDVEQEIVDILGGDEQQGSIDDQLDPSSDENLQATSESYMYKVVLLGFSCYSQIAISCQTYLTSSCINEIEHALLEAKKEIAAMKEQLDISNT